ncbi:hypothetical protein [Sphingobacterium sp.]|uniref:hypothetical protein n=1 Tax=Sphingobacterium sp. TaxID=341027 RepID=UPI0031E1B6AF
MYFNKIKWLGIAGLITMTAISCSTNKDKNEISSSDSNISIRSVKYINDDHVTDINVISDEDGSSAKLSASTQNAKTAENTLDIQKSAEFDYTADLQSNATIKTSTNSGLARASVDNKLKAANIPLTKDKKFRLVFVEDGQSTPLYNDVLNAGQDPQLKVAAGKKYHWYAFSVNDANTVPNIDGSGNISPSDLTNKDFMFDSGDITTTEDQNYLDIIFLRQMAAIDVTVNTRGIFGGITNNSTFSVGSGTGTNFTNLIQTGTFNVYNGSFSNLQDAEPLKGSQMTAVDSRWGNAEKTGRFFTANTTATIAANNLRIRLNSLNIALDDNTTRTFSSNTLVPVSHAASLSLAKGTLSKTSIRLIESGIKVGNVVWARTNMIYDANKLYGSAYTKGSSDAYRFRTNNEYAYPNVNAEYWNFGASTPTGTDVNTVDGCGRVFPEGTWRYPQELNNPKEMTLLSQNTDRTTLTKQVSDGYRHSIIWNTTQAANPAYPDNKLVISYYGYRDANGVVQQNPSNSQTGTGTLHLRSNQYTNNGNAYILYSQLQNGSFGGTSVPNTSQRQGVQIRCVRAKLNN